MLDAYPDNVDPLDPTAPWNQPDLDDEEEEDDMGYIESGDAIKFDTDYLGVWFTPENEAVRLRLRERLIDNWMSTVVDFMPGDGTRYSFLLVPEDVVVTVSSSSDSTVYGGDRDVLQVVILNGLGDGVGTFNRRLGGEMENIRWRVENRMHVPNPCTREALAATVFALWA